MTDSSSAPRRSLPRSVVSLLRWFIILTLPVFLVLTSVRLVANEVFLWLEYHRPGFPDDPYGLTREQRLEYGPYGVRYMTNDAGIHYLAEIEIDGETAFREKELKHMEDVKVVARVAFQVHTTLTLALVASVAALAWRRDTRHDLRLALSGGGVFTIGLMLTLVVSAVAAWDMFFDAFHSVFFEGDSWRFYNSDTLIRLYPEQFWFDVAMVIGVLTLGGAVGAIWGMGVWERRAAQKTNNGATADPVGENMPADTSESVPQTGSD